MSGKSVAVSSPTYMRDIRHFFEEIDIDHMRRRGIELGTYEGVKSNALRTYFRTKEGTMPPPPQERWSDARVETFYNWMKNGYPRGTAEPRETEESGLEVDRMRRNITELNSDEIDKVKRAFFGLMNRDPDDPQSYFALAGLHWLPGPDFYCRHHENAYNPWHRVYLNRFEDAMRSIPGCEDVTLPYWDITDSEIPPVLFEQPFDAYVIPRNLCTITGNCYGKDYVTKRNDAKEILEQISQRGIPTNIQQALAFSHWERFNGWDAGRTQDGIIRAHDNGHNAIGITMRNQDVAAFDPIFWFFHCNWDRLFWKWQQDYGATTLGRFRTHLLGSADWLDDPVVDRLPPFLETSGNTIDLTALGIGYEHPAGEPMAESGMEFLGSVTAQSSFEVMRRPQASLRVKGVDRLEIPGSFDVIVKVGGKIVAQHGFFQSTTPKHCATCRKNAIVSFDFLLDLEVLQSDRISVSILLLREDGSEGIVPLSTCGNPTVNVRMLLDQ